MPNRKDQKFCSPGCRKTDHSRKDRKKNPHNSKFSPTKWRENYELFDLNRCLVEQLCKKKTIHQRSELIQRIIALAEEGHGQLRAILTNLKFLNPDKNNSLLFCPGYEGMGTIAQIANRYSWVTWGCSITDVLKNQTYWKNP